MRRHVVALVSVLAAAVASAASAQVRVVADVDYVTAADYPDKKDKLDIYVPATADKAAVIVSIHGGGLRQGTSRHRPLSASASRRRES